MPRIRYLTADVFTDRPFGGNPLAVFPDASAIPEALLGPIAREFNYSETTFVFPPSDPKHTRRVRIFTPGGELPFAGHPTLGTAHVLAVVGEVPTETDLALVVFEEGAGPVPVALRFREGVPVYAELTAPHPPEVGEPSPSRERLAEALSLSPADVLDGDWAPQAVSCGVPFVFVPLRDRDTVSRARLRVDAWEAHLRGAWASKVFVFARDPHHGSSHLRARMFAPGVGVPEDPATGSACAALGGYLGARDPRHEGTLEWTIEQGIEMGRPSLIAVRAEKHGGLVTAVRVGGRSVIVCDGTIDIPG